MEDEKGWCANYIECDICTHKWTSVYHIDCDKLECPNCHNMVDYSIIK